MRRALPAVLFWTLITGGTVALLFFEGWSFLRVVKVNLKIHALGQLGKTGNQITYAQDNLDLARRALGDKSYLTRIAYDQLFALYRNQSRFREALAISEDRLRACHLVYGAEHTVTADVMGDVALAYTKVGRSIEGMETFLAAIAILEKTADGKSVLGRHLVGLTGELLNQGKLDDATRLLQRVDALSGDKDVESSDPKDRARAGIQDHTKQVADIERKLGPGHRDLAPQHELLALDYLTLDQLKEAKIHAERAVRIFEDFLGKDNLGLTRSLGTLARVHARASDWQNVLLLRQRILRIATSALPNSHPEVGEAFTKLAEVKARLGQWLGAYEDAIRAVSVMVEQPDFSIETLKRTSVAMTFNNVFEYARRVMGQRDGLVQDTFLTAQWALQSSASIALAQMAARTRASSGDLAEMTRRRETLVERQKQLNASLLQIIASASDKRDQTGEARTYRQNIENNSSELRAIDRTFQLQFPEYASLIRPQPLSIEDVQKLLAPNEVLVQYLAIAGEMFVWVVNGGGDEPPQFISLYGTHNLFGHVDALRCGLDHTAWRDDEERCQKLLNTTYAYDDYLANEQLPFDMARAHELYRLLLAPLEQNIKRKHLLIVPSGRLTSLPFQVLLTAPPIPDGDFVQASWLGLRQPITVLPSIASLEALRKVKESDATRPYFGVGDPTLIGNNQCPKNIRKTACPASDITLADATQTSPLPRSSNAKALGTYYRSGYANLENVRSLCKLPDTADELKCVAKNLLATENEILLGDNATEQRVKALSASGEMANYRVLHFATHGLLAGEAEQLAAARAEPALVLTPPPDGRDDSALIDDDGLLTASEVATLRLDADWVIMSACNTAAGGNANAESLSGLARAFFYAGARALLVSHWEVYSEAAVKLTTKTFAEIIKAKTQGNPIGRAEAMRLAMKDVISENGYASHPAYWAPFVVVGEGGK